VFSRDIYENVNPLHSVFCITILLQMHTNNDGRSNLKCTDRKSVGLNFYAVFVLQIHSAKLA
jgi:hypothetical protein